MLTEIKCKCHHAFTKEAADLPPSLGSLLAVWKTDGGHDESSLTTQRNSLEDASSKRWTDPKSMIGPEEQNHPME